MDFSVLIESARKTIPCLVQFLEYLKSVIVRNENVGQLKCPEDWSDFVYALASPSPVCALVRPIESVLSLLKRLMEKEDLRHDPKAMQAIQHEIPVIYKLLYSCSNPIPDALCPIIKRLIELCEVMDIEYQAEMLQTESSEAVLSTDVDDMKFFPKIPKLRHRRLYSADNTKARICTKKAYGHHSLLPGIFTFIVMVNKHIYMHILLYSAA